MRGIQGISEELDRLLEPLNSRDLERIVEVSLGITLEEYRRDPDIRGAIEAYRADPVAARALADDLARLAERCDDEYAEAGDLGEKEKADSSFDQMCVFNGLTLLLSAPSLTPKVVDRLIYDLGHGAADTDLFAERMIQKLQKITG